MAECDLTLPKRCSACGTEKLRTEFFKASCCKDGLRGECKACVKSKQQAYNLKNAEVISDQKKTKYYADGALEPRRAKNAAYYRLNCEYLKSRARIHHALNAAQISESRKAKKPWLNPNRQAWRDANREHVRLYGREFYQKNKDRLMPGRKAAKAMRRASGRVEAGVIPFLVHVQRGKCPSCRVSLNRSGYHLDHIQPLARGGTNARVNLQLLCPHCNLTKSAKDPIDFMRSRGFLL